MVGVASVTRISIASSASLILYHRWVYLFFFNTLWVWIPFWILCEAYYVITGALKASDKPSTKKRQ